MNPVKLTPPPGVSPDDWKRLHADARKPGNNPAVGNVTMARRVLDFVSWWNDTHQCKPVKLDCRPFSKRPNSVRQEFFNVRTALRDNPDFADEVARLYPDGLYNTLFKILDGGIQFNVTRDDDFLQFSPAISDKVNPYITNAYVIESNKMSLKARFEEWLTGDMATRFEAVNEKIDDELEAQLRTVASAYDDLIVYAISPSTLLAARREG